VVDCGGGLITRGEAAGVGGGLVAGDCVKALARVKNGEEGSARAAPAQRDWRSQ